MISLIDQSIKLISLIWIGGKLWKSCRSRKNLMLEDVYLGAKIVVDTAENEPSEVAVAALPGDSRH
tara:strand:+ start:529 stop:726 length:198 start_codon:yes stop_codon:yes gene_type:complete